MKDILEDLRYSFVEAFGEGFDLAIRFLAWGLAFALVTGSLVGAFLLGCWVVRALV